MAQETEKEILSKIAQMKEFAHVRLAKQYFRALPTSELYDELCFLISDYTPEEFLQWCNSHKRRKTIKKIIYGVLSWIKK